jgi:hypothetical protein
MSRRQITVAILVLGVAVLVAVWFLGRRADLPVVGPSRPNFQRLREGMALAEVEAVLGPAGLSYSSDKSYQYYIWKGQDGWRRVWVRQSKVSKLEFDPTLSLDD